MEANPASRKVMISWMTAELADNLGYLKRKHMRNSAPKDALPGARYRDKSSKEWNGEGRLDDVRFPWIHSREPVVFHSSKRLPRKNHCAFPGAERRTR
jgi:hypothetical protein